ncbi:2-C-methyl-D-erythritol 2,4-cyclodiphosphate synthase [Candidatus Woesearchaeota archaeon]|nr:2-C-methyl-D-erythritol 2,4-cyclodiphosphate synthase [Candidatus Woesearchaeota archaeon]
MKVGIGTDSHAFEDGKPLILGGHMIKDNPGLKGNSDGDVIIHALCNAIASTIGVGSIASYADKICENGVKDSSKYLEHVMKIMTSKNLTLNNISIALECSKPKLEGHLHFMRENLSSMTKLPIDDIGITVTSGENLSAFGKGKGIYAIVIVSIG